MSEETASTTNKNGDVCCPTPEVKPDVPQAPYELLGKYSENSITCYLCGLPGGKISFKDVNGKIWNITTNTNLVRKTKDVMAHENMQVCLTGKNFRPASKKEETQESKS